MYKRWVGSLVAGVFLLGCMSVPALAGLNRGDFVPASRSQAVTAGGAVKYYQVQKGDTLWDISRSFKVDVQTVAAMNNLNSKSVLDIGQTLQLPATSSRMHVICRGETMWDIAARYDVSLASLQRANPDDNPKNLKIGDKLLIPEESYQRAVTAAGPSRGWSVSGVFNWPVFGVITSGYGWRKSGFHHGIDIATDLGEPIKACAAGKVTFAGYKSIYGRTVIIEHPDGKETLYAHVQTIKTKQGETVARGEVIATVGVTGRTTGPHVHLEVRQNGELCNPLTLLRR